MYDKSLFREALYLIERDMIKYHYKQISMCGDASIRIVNAKSPDGTLYQYIYDARSVNVEKYRLQPDMSSRTLVGKVG